MEGPRITFTGIYGSIHDPNGLVPNTIKRFAKKCAFDMKGIEAYVYIKKDYTPGRAFLYEHFQEDDANGLNVQIGKDIVAVVAYSKDSDGTACIKSAGFPTAHARLEEPHLYKIIEALIPERVPLE